MTGYVFMESIRTFAYLLETRKQFIWLHAFPNYINFNLIQFSRTT